MHKVKGFVPYPTVMAFDSGSDFHSLGLGYGAAVPWKKSVPGTSPEQLPLSAQGCVVAALSWS